MKTYYVQYSDGTSTRVQASSDEQARNRGYKYNRSGVIVTVHPV
ncbi:hypothetical protein J2X63_003160 [Agromyces sp. 3263]|nr:hypothetical protein [Agromyces sp. 3263]MDR6907452.1 hypothetical protein [Agromyces sp. 3263]